MADHTIDAKNKPLGRLATQIASLLQDKNLPSYAPHKEGGNKVVVKNVHLDAVEHGDHIVFLHQVKDGAASQSYGLQVARLAGIPKKVITRAQQKLVELERQNLAATKPNVVREKQADLFTQPNIDHVSQQLKQLDIDQLTPREALQALYQLKEQVL